MKSEAVRRWTQFILDHDDELDCHLCKVPTLDAKQDAGDVPVCCSWPQKAENVGLLNMSESERATERTSNHRLLKFVPRQEAVLA